MVAARVPVISLFAGAGVLDYAIESTSRFQVIVAVELDPTFSQTLRANANTGLLSTTRVLCEDVRNLDPRRVIEDGPGRRPFGIVGGPPCQSFSSMGRK